MIGLRSRKGVLPFPGPTAWGWLVPFGPSYLAAAPGRNPPPCLDRRVEALVRVTDPTHLAQLMTLFDLAMSDATSSWWLDASGTWVRHHLDEHGNQLVDLQDQTMNDVQSRRRARATR